MTPRFVSPEVTREHPWPGLMPFTEEARAFFHGRDEEVAELLRLIRRQTLTVLFGLSGLGKSSLVNAGLFPRLREDDFLPIYIRLDVLSGEPLARQALGILVADAGAHGVEAPHARADENLWEYFHRRDADFWSPRNRLLTPVLVFDQFEELFTLGRHAPDAAQRCRDFLEELADLVEGRTPAETLLRIEHEPARADRIDYARTTFKVVLAFREDYLPDFEALRGAMPSIMRGRMRLTRMNGSQARSAILDSGGHLVSEAVCERIIRFVASARTRGAEESELARLEIEPALLSVVCRELNNKRIAQGLSQISADLLEGGAQQEIIREFYEESLSDLDPRIGEFIEDQLLTEAGYRDSCALEDALRLPGVTREAIDTLIARRLVRLDERAGVLRVELTHDVLTRVAKDSRDQRKERETQRVEQEKGRARKRRVRGLVAVGAVVLAGSVGLAATFALLLERSNDEKRRLVETQSNVLLEQSIGQLDRNVPSEPQAILAEAMRLNPANGAAVARTVTYLSRRPFARETGGRTLAAGERGVDPRAGVSFLVGKAPDITVVELDTGRAIGAAHKVAVAPTAVAIAADRSRMAWDEGPGRVVLSAPGSAARTELVLQGLETQPVRDLGLAPDGSAMFVRTEAGARLYSLVGREPVVEALPADLALLAESAAPFAISPRGEWLAFADRRKLVAWDRTGRVAAWAVDHSSPVNALAFSDDGKLIATASQDKYARIYRLEDRRMVGAPLAHEGSVIAVAFGKGGEDLITGSLDRSARIWSLRSSAPLVEPLVRATPVVHARVSEGGKGAATLDAAGRFALWETSAAEPALALVPGEEAVSAWEPSPDGRQVATFSDKGGVRVFDAAAPGAPAQAWARPAVAGAAPARLGRFSADGRRLAVALADGTVELRAMPAGTMASALRLPRAARLLEFNPDGTLLAVATEDDVLRIFETGSGARRGLPMDTLSRLQRIQFAPTGNVLLALESQGRVRVWDAATTLPIASVDPSAKGRRVAFAGFTGREWELVVVEEKLARLVEVRAEKGGGYKVLPLATLPFLNTAWTADLSTAERRLVVGGVDGTARLVELDTFRLAGSAMKHDGVVVGVAFSPDSRWVVSRTEQSARVWHARTGFPVADAVRHENGVASAALLGGGAYLLTGEAGAAPRLTRIHLDFPDPRPEWLPALVEAAGRGRFDRSGGVAPIEDARGEMAALRQTVAKDSSSAWWKHWATQVLARLDGPGGKP